MNEKPNWDDLRLFLAVAREGGLSPAAKLTERSPATLSRRMLALEQVRRETLFLRHDRGYELTHDGKALLAALTGVERELEALSRPAQDNTRSTIKVSAGSWTTLHLLGRMSDLAGSPPDVMLQFVAAEAVLDMPHRTVAIGVRNHRPTASNLAARQIGRAAFAPYATPDAPDLWIKVIAETPSANWVADHVGQDVVCEVTAPRNSLDLALAGQGIALLPTFVGKAYPTLEQRGDIIAALTHDRWVVTHQDDRHRPDVRRVVDRLYDVFAD